MIPNRVHPVEKSEYNTSLVLSSLVLAFCFFNIHTEIKQLINLGRRRYFKVILNFLDLSVIGLTIIAFILNLVDLLAENGLDDNSNYAFKTILFVYLKMLSYGRAFDSTSYLIRLLIQVIFDIRIFLLYFYL